MGKASILLIKTRAVLAALVLTFLAFGPSLDQMICGNEGAGAAVAAEVVIDNSHNTPAMSASHDHKAPNHAGDESGVCSHGHCHHGAIFVADADPALDSTSAEQDQYRLVRSAPPITDFQFGLKRPPRS